MEQELNIRAVILISGLDFGRCPIASKLSTAMWPIDGKPVLMHLLSNLENQGIKKVVLCPYGDSSFLQDIVNCFGSMDISILDEPLPVGTAGSIRNVADKNKNEKFIVLKGTTVLVPDINILMQIHQTGQSDLTIIFNSNQEESEIYICDSSVLKFIPQQGYFDIKEGLIPGLTRIGKTVYVATLPEPIGNFRDRKGYLKAAALYIQNKLGNSSDYMNGQNPAIAESAKIEPGAKIIGSVIVMENCHIAEGSVIFGPAIIGRNVTIERNSILENSILWDNSFLGNNCQLCNCLVDQNLTIRPYTNVADTVLTLESTNLFNHIIKKGFSVVFEYCRYIPDQLEKIVKTKIPSLAGIQHLRSSFYKFIAISILIGIFSWSYWPEISNLWSVWQSSDEYSSGILVPFLAIYILWARRKNISQCPVQYSLWGLFFFIGAQLLRYFGMFFMFSAAERLSLVLSIAALTLLLFGKKLFSKIAFIFIFLCLMLPFPRSVHTSIMLPLQNLATSSAAICLETLGFAAYRQGNVLYINDIAIAIAEACNGLRMVTSFFIIVGLMMFLVHRTWWEKIIMLFSALPIAIICNTIRLTVTAIFFATFNNSQYDELFHSLGGYAMMPLAIAIVILELWLLAKLTKEPDEPKTQIIIQRSALA